jgi:hypothetical protein
MKLTTAASLFLCSILSIASVSTHQNKSQKKSTNMTTQALLPTSRPIDPSFNPGGAITDISILCNPPTATPIKLTLAKDTLARFCTEHQGVNLARGGNFSTYYDDADADDDASGSGMRLFFNVENQCAPNGVYLPLSACVEGFTAVTRCPGGGYGNSTTRLGKAEAQCLGFEVYAEVKGDVDED